MTNLAGSLDTALALKNPWAVVPSLGHLDAYISAVNRMPMLTLEQEQEFARKLKNENDLEAAGKLVLSHLRVVVSVARQYLGYGLPHADLIQEGNIGLMKAVKRYDPDQGVRLVISALTAPIVGHTIIFGMSDNQTSWWDNTHAKHIGYRALDSSDVFRHEVEARQPHIDRHDKAALFQGGAFVKIAPHGE